MNTLTAASPRELRDQLAALLGALDSDTSGPAATASEPAQVGRDAAPTPAAACG